MEFNSQSAIAFARLLVTLAVGVATVFGWTLDAELWLNIILSIAGVVLFAYSWWKNNNITSAAQEAQEVLNEIKQREVKIGGTE